MPVPRVRTVAIAAPNVTHHATGSSPTIRVARVSDAPIIAEHRAAMFRDMGVLDEADVPALREAARAYLTGALADGRYRGWLAEVNGAVVVAGAGLVTYAALPRPEKLTGGEDAYVFNVYTAPAHRGRGLARNLMVVILAWCRDRGITCVNLHASDAGRRLYERLGFTRTREMRLVLTDHSG
jgi:GNAT superfamily N-acetyltransferase